MIDLFIDLLLVSPITTLPPLFPSPSLLSSGLRLIPNG